MRRHITRRHTSGEGVHFFRAPAAPGVDRTPGTVLTGGSAVQFVTDELEGFRHSFPRQSVGRLGGRWEELTFSAAAALGDPARFELPLTTWTDTPLTPGATSLSVLTAGDLGVPGGDWFSPGDRVVFDPGGAYEQVLTLTVVDGHTLRFAAADALLPDSGDATQIPAGYQVLFLPAGSTIVGPGGESATSPPAGVPTPGHTATAGPATDTLASRGGNLSYTGTDSVRFVLPAAVAVVVGAAMCLGQRQRRRRL